MINVINMKTTGPESVAVLTSDAACAALGVSRQTLYAYVSRGLVRATPDPDDPRRSRYDRRDIEALAARKRRGRSRESVARSTLDWGEPVLSSAITQIVDGELYYRGRLATELAEVAPLEEVAARLVGSSFRRGGVVPPSRIAPLEHDQPFARMVRRAGEIVADTVADGRDIAPEALLQAMAAAAAGLARCTGPIHDVLAGRWGADAGGSDILRRALVLSADHELNASAYATRVAASAGATLQACLLAGLGTLSGPKHGGMTAVTLGQMRHLSTDPNLRRSVRTLVRRGAVPGFGHPLYPDGDPRAMAMISACGWPRGWERAAAAISDETGERPSLDFVLALTEERLALPDGAGLAIFALGRTAGWLAHVIEQRQDGKLIRPRAAAPE